MSTQNYNMPRSIGATGILPRCLAMSEQLDCEAVLIDLGIEVDLVNIQAVAHGKALMETIKPRRDGSFFVADRPESRLQQVVSLGRAIVDVPSPYCTCELWRIHHERLSLMVTDSRWLCKHGAVVLMAEGYSQTYLEWQQSLVKPAKSMQASKQYDEAIDRKRFFAALNNGGVRKLAAMGLTIEQVKEAYRRRFGVDSLSLLTQEQWAIASAEVAAMVKWDELLKQRAAEIKIVLGGTS